MARIRPSHQNCRAFIARPGWPDRHKDKEMADHPPKAEASLMDLVTKLPLMNDLFEEEEAEGEYGNAAAITNEAFTALSTNPAASLNPDMDIDTDIETITHDEPTHPQHDSLRTLSAIVSSLPQLNDLFEEEEEEQEQEDLTLNEPSLSPDPPSRAKLSTHHHRPTAPSQLQTAPLPSEPTHLPHPSPTTELFPGPPLLPSTPGKKSTKHPKQLAHNEDETYFSCSDDENGDDDDESLDSPTVVQGGCAVGEISLEEVGWATTTSYVLICR